MDRIMFETIIILYNDQFCKQVGSTANQVKALELKNEEKVQ